MGRAEDLFVRVERDRESALDELIVSRKSEELFLDFKRSSDNGAGYRLSDQDRNNLARAISGFGNSEGGVVVWGIDCSRGADGADVARLKKPITNVARFVSWLEGVVSGCTVPPHSGVRHLAISLGESGDGYTVSFIPQSDRAPHQMVGEMRYYIRAGSSFAPVPHAVLAGMFGQRPQPHVFATFACYPMTITGDIISCSMGIVIRNQGPGIATDLFVNVELLTSPGDKCRLAVEPGDLTTWIATWSFRRHMSLICKPEVRLPPEAHLQPAVLAVTIAPPFDGGIDIEGMVGSGRSAPHRFRLGNAKEKIVELYNSFMQRTQAGVVTEAELQQFSSWLLESREK